MNTVPRVRMFAGPNGSGKSTIKSVIRPELIGLFINPDELEKEIRECGALDVGRFGFQTSENEIANFFESSSLLKKNSFTNIARHVFYASGKLRFTDIILNSYFASVAADFIRRKLLLQKTSFSFETVMSSPDKIAFMADAQKAGYRTYLYYVATESPEINIQRVRNRVRLGGHAVPEDKIVSRYGRSLGMLHDAIRHTNRAYIFDNSQLAPIWLAEITDGKQAELKTELIPDWFRKTVWENFKGTPK